MRTETEKSLKEVQRASSVMKYRNIKIAIEILHLNTSESVCETW